MANRTNSDRADDAACAVKTHALVTGILNEAEETQVGDLLTNLRHYCNALDIDWRQVLESSKKLALAEMEKD